MQSESTLIIGLGNTILGDDGVGIYAAREIKKTWPQAGAVEIKEASLGGIAILDLMAGYDRAIVVDAIQTGQYRPGTILKLGVEELGGGDDIYGSHTFGLKTAVELGRILGYEIPRTIQIYAVEIENSNDFYEGLSPEIQKAVPLLVSRIIADLES